MLAESFSLYRVFSSHMVLQRERPVVFSGKAETGRQVVVAFAGMERRAAADGSGEWRAEFPAMPAGGPWTLVLSGAPGTAPVRLEDILVGEVWMCTGQSNMEMPVFSENPFWRTLHAEEELQQASHPQIRLFNAMPTRRMAPDGPLADECGAVWRCCDSETVKDFSACGYFFGRALEQDLNVPIGLIASAWGGTDIEAWISREKFEAERWAPIVNEPDEAQRAWKALLEAGEMKPLQEWLAQFDALGAVAPLLLALDTADGDWLSSQGGTLIFQKPGRFLCRIALELPDDYAGRDIVLEPGAFNDMDQCFFNGESIGETGLEKPDYWAVRRRYEVPGRLVRAGRNVVAVVVDNHYCQGAVNLMDWRVSCGERALTVSVSCRWKTIFELPADFPTRPAIPGVGGNRTPDSPNYPSTLFNGMLAPWFRYTVRGVIWYQGCNNNGQTTYYPYHKMLIDDLREHWQNPELPFLLVQLAAFHAHCPDSRLDDAVVEAMPFPEFSPYAMTREIQAEMPRVRKQVGMVVAFDRGDHSDIHPRDKQTLGLRLARKAEQMVYGNQQLADGPEFAGCRQEGAKMRVYFRHIGTGLTTDDGEAPKGFVLGDRTGKLYPAQAVIDGDTVVVSASAVLEPQRVRYAFTGYCRVNLQNRAGLPAVPFRSDKVDYEAMFCETSLMGK